MYKMLAMLGMVAAVTGLGIFVAEAGTIRATELNAKNWSRLEKGKTEDLVIEFRQGDQIAVALQTEGDLLDTRSANPSYFYVKRSFWVRMEQNQILLSLDGVRFKPFHQMTSGTFSVDASADQKGGPANAINMLFKVHLK